MCSDYSVSRIHQVAKFKEPYKVPYLIKLAATVSLLTYPWLFSLLLQFPALPLPTLPLGVDLTRTVQTLLASSKISKTSSLCLNYVNDGLMRFLLSVLNPCHITILKKKSQNDFSPILSLFATSSATENKNGKIIMFPSSSAPHHHFSKCFSSLNDFLPIKEKHL